MNPSVEANSRRSYHYQRTTIGLLSDSEMARRKHKPMAKGLLKSNDRRHYYHVFLWGSQVHYEESLKIVNEGTQALCVTDTYKVGDDYVVNPKLGELHFVSGQWDVNAVAHEVQHALIHRLRYLNPTPEQVLDENSSNHNPEHEEIIAYEAGAWVEACLVWLTNTDPASIYPANVFDR